MKLHHLTIALTGLAAASAVTAECTDKPVPWSQVDNKNAMHWALYSQPQGTDLRNVKPEYHDCSAVNPRGADVAFAAFGGKDFEFQLLPDGTMGVNCIDCTPQMLGNYYLTRIGDYIECKMYEGSPFGSELDPQQVS